MDSDLVFSTSFHAFESPASFFAHSVCIQNDSSLSREKWEQEAGATGTGEKKKYIPCRPSLSMHIIDVPPHGTLPWIRIYAHPYATGRVSSLCKAWPRLLDYNKGEEEEVGETWHCSFLSLLLFICLFVTRIVARVYLVRLRFKPGAVRSSTLGRWGALTNLGRNDCDDETNVITKRVWYRNECDVGTLCR